MDFFDPPSVADNDKCNHNDRICKNVMLFKEKK
jgi:hypothetical protein